MLSPELIDLFALMAGSLVGYALVSVAVDASRHIQFAAVYRQLRRRH